jgi:ribokinase
MSASRQLFVIGDANPDLIVRGTDVTPRFGQAERLVEAADLVVGGSAAIMACGAARLGVSTHVVSVVGDDVYGQFMLDALHQRGVNASQIRIDPTMSTGLSVILSNPNDRAILTHLGVLELVTSDLIDPATVPDDAHVHATSYFLMPALAAGLGELFAALRARGCTTSLDTNWDPAEQWSGVLELLDHVDIFLPNEAELRAITGCDDLSEAADIATAHGCTVVAKCGADGAHVWTLDEHHFVAAPTIDVVDTTGAGDSFDAGYIAALLRGESAERALEEAVACGSLSTRAAGGTASQATRAETDRLVAEMRQ